MYKEDRVVYMGSRQQLGTLVLPPPHESMHLQQPSWDDRLQGGETELPKMAILWLGERSVTTPGSPAREKAHWSGVST